ncbi:hypothetical protein P43SY_006226 [Pythium insidiosum]|uniref:MORN repeat-containing protein 3 n=1 Tax=Pythium insidiosum TaxID=114742 RepID=A0AAD5Q879_PYTIN|nr:hypothetical protein P43SY_006226 [Pythium insidiosum]
MTLTASQRVELLAARNGPRRSVYWVRPTRTARASTSSAPSAVSDLSAGAAHVEYTVTGKYTGDWQHGEKHGFGVFEYANGSKYEGEWSRGQRSGRGTFWVLGRGAAKKGTKALRKQYAGEWLGDQRHGSGTFFYEDGGRYDGDWERNQRSGRGRMVYGKQGGVYDGQWLDNERSGPGVLRLANGDVYDGHWLHDKKEGPGRFFYAATRKIYDGEWADDAPRCGTYQDADDARESDAAFALPELGLAHPARVVSESIALVRRERLLEQAFRAQQQDAADKQRDGDGDSSRDGDETRGPEAVATGARGSEDEAAGVVFDDESMRLLQREFEALARRDGTIACETLPSLLAALGLVIPDEHVLAFLEELGATPQTSVSFAECVDMVSLLAESEMEAIGGEMDEHDEGDDEEDEEKDDA